MSILELSPLFTSASSITKSNDRTPSTCSRIGSITTELKDNGIRGVDHKLLEKLVQDNVDKKLITEEIENLSEQYDLKAVNWRQRMIHFLHSQMVGGVLLCLVLIDVIVVLLNVIIELEIMQDQNTMLKNENEEIRHIYEENCTRQREHADVVHHSSNSSEHELYRRNVVAGGTSHYDNTVELKIHRLEYINSLLHYLSVAVLAVFVVEAILKLIGYGVKLFHSKLEAVDIFVVVASFTLDLVMLGAELNRDPTKTVFIIPFLLWRLMRVLNALSVTMRMRNKFRLQILRKSKKAADEKIRDQTIDCSDKAAEIKRLQCIARRHGVEEHELQAARVLSKSSVTSQPAISSMAAKTVVLTNILGYKYSMSESCVNIPTRRPSEISDCTRHQHKYASSLGISCSAKEARRTSAMFDTDGPYTRMKTLGKSIEDVKQNYLTVQGSYPAAVANHHQNKSMSLLTKSKQANSTDQPTTAERKKTSNDNNDQKFEIFYALRAADKRDLETGISIDSGTVEDSLMIETQTSADECSPCIYTRLMSRRAKASLNNPPTINISHVDDV